MEITETEDPAGDGNNELDICEVGIGMGVGDC